MFRRYDRPARLFDPRQPASETARTVRALDLGHRLRNPVGVVRLVVGDEVARRGRRDRGRARRAPRPAPSWRAMATACALPPPTGTSSSPPPARPRASAWTWPDAFRRLGLGTGDVLAPPPAELMTAVGELETVLARDESFWLGRRGRRRSRPSADAGWHRSRQPLRGRAAADDRRRARRDRRAAGSAARRRPRRSPSP